MWTAMGAVAKTVSILLIALSIISLYLFIERQMTFARARRKSKEVAPKLADLLRAGNIKDALSLASKKDNKGSHLARVTAAGITEFMEGKEARLSFDQQVETATRGCERAATMFSQELKRGLSILATIATSSPFIGLFGTISGIINAFRGMALTGSGGIGAVAGGISEALVTTAFGIGVAIIALWCYNSLNSKVEVYEAEMTNTTSQVVDFFIRTGHTA
jgi:biopolymer transport protein ExbB/TolQ